MLQSTTYWIHVSKIRSSLDPCLKIRCTLDPCLKTITHWISLTGTTFHYERKYKNSKARGPLTLFAPESIRALGPTTEALFIVVCIQHHSSSMLFQARRSKLSGVVPRRKSGRRVWIFLEEGCHERDSIRWTRTYLNRGWIGFEGRLVVTLGSPVLLVSATLPVEAERNRERSSARQKWVSILFVCTKPFSRKLLSESTKAFVTRTFDQKRRSLATKTLAGQGEFISLSLCLFVSLSLCLFVLKCVC